MQRFPARSLSRATPRWLAAPWLTTFLALSAQAAPDARFVATPLQGDPCVAPCAVHFDAIGDGTDATVDPAYTREFHTLLFEWDFGEPGAGTWSVTGADKNQALGAIAGHVYALPGSYTVTLTVTNPAGETSVAQREVVIADPDVVLSASETWCFANSAAPGAFAACPTTDPARHMVISAATAGGFDTALNTHCNADAAKARCLFRAGDTFLQESFLQLAQTTAGPGLVSSFGSGAKPQIVGGPGFLVLGDGWTVAHFDVQLDGAAAFPQALFQLNPERGHTLAWDVRGRGLRAPCFVTQTGSAAVHNDRVGIVELDCQNNAGTPELTEPAGLFLRAERVLVLGNSIDNNYEGQFALRTVHFPRSIIQHNRIQRPQENAGDQRNVIQIRAWAGDPGMPGPPPTPPAPSPTEWVIVSDNVLSQDNAFNMIRVCQTNTCADATGAPDAQNMLFERNFLFLSTGGSGPLGSQIIPFDLQGGDLTVRNNVIDLQGVDPANGAQIRLVQHQAPSASGLNNDNVHVLNNTLYFDEITGRTTYLCGGTSGAGSGHECRNNLAWLPNQTGGRFFDDGEYLSSNNVFAADAVNPFVVDPVPGQGQTSPGDFEPGAQASDVIDGGFDFGDGPFQVRLDFAGRCRPADGDQSGSAEWDVGAFEVSADTSCRSAPPPEPVCTTGFGKGSFSVSENSPGREKLKATLARGPLLTQASFGDPTAVDGTVVALHVFDDTGTRVALLEVDRAGESCGSKPCWKSLGGAAPTGKGFSYKDAAASASGVRSLKLKAGAAGKSSIAVSAANKGQGALPTGIAQALSGTTSVTLEVHTSDAACFSATLLDVIRQESGFFKAR